MGGAASTTKLLVRPPSMDDDEKEEDDVLPPPVRIRLGSRVESVDDGSADATTGEGIDFRGVGATGRVDGGWEIKVASTGGAATCDGGRGGREPRGRRRGRVELGQHPHGSAPTLPLA